jgi:glutamate-1-semialdehyde 2,1-aminomutase
MGAPLPYALRGKGCRVWDDRGRELVDLNNNFTSLIHGHAHPEIIAAAASAMRAGTCFGLPNVYEWEHAEALLDRFPDLDQVRYTNSGTEAVMTAVRIARAATGRSGCLMIRDSYHGTSDVALSTGAERLRRGIPSGVLEDTTCVGVNDAACLREIIERDSDRYAAIVIDLMPAGTGLMQVDRSFARLARELASRHGIVLIIDEVISFRLGFHGLSGDYGVDPDMVTLGKAIGGGFPVGAIVGTQDVMRELDPTSPVGLEHGGTFSANPVTLAAGAVSLRLLTTDAIRHLNSSGEQMRSSIEKELDGLDWEVRGRGSLLHALPSGPEAGGKDTARQLFWVAYERGILLGQNGMASLSTAMDDELASDVARRLADAVIAVSSATRRSEARSPE